MATDSGKLEHKIRTTSWKELLKANAAWWININSKADYFPHCEDRSAVLLANPLFKKSTLVELNQHVVTLDSQEGSCEAQFGPVAPEFVRQEKERGHISEEFPDKDIDGKQFQRPYVTFIATKGQAATLRQKLDKKYTLIISTKEKGTIDGREPDKSEKSGINVTFVTLRAPNGLVDNAQTTHIFCESWTGEDGIDNKEWDNLCQINILYRVWIGNGELMLRSVIDAIA